MLNDRYYIEIIIARIEKKVGWGPISQWTDHEYKKLSACIYEETAISISSQTLKRLFGKIKYKNEYKVQPATRDALARFLGYTGWDNFTGEHKRTAGKIFSNIRLPRPRISNSVFIGAAAAGVVLTMVLLLRPAAGKKEVVTFYAENVTGMVPHTVSIHYDISGLKNDVFIDFDQNEAEMNTEGELLDKQMKLINHCFESPGFFNVRLKSRGRLLDSVKVHVLSNGWSTYYFNDDNFRLRKFVFGLEHKVQAPDSTGMLYISPDELTRKGFNGNTVYYLEHMIYKDFRVSSDSCLLEVKYRNSSDIGGISCYDVEFRIIAENGLTSLILVQKGCYRWSEITVGDKHINGKYNDLSFLGADLARWNTMKIKLGHNTVSFVNNNDTIFTTGYARDLGPIKGLRLLTKGSGAFDYVRLSDAAGNLVYQDEFGN